MSISLPTGCTNPKCRGPSIKPIHCLSRPIAIDAIDGPPVFTHFITLRCTECGQTWAIRGYSADENAWNAIGEHAVTAEAPTDGRGWWGRMMHPSHGR